MIITLLGLVQWESWFNIDIRNRTLQNLVDGELAFSGIFLFVCIGFPLILNRTRGFLQGFLFLLFPFILLVSGSIWLVVLFMPADQWDDKYVYQNGDDYIVVEEMTEEFLGNDPYIRLVRTNSPNDMIRIIEDAVRMYPSDDTYEKGSSEINFANKTWRKVFLPEE
jgi:hypothetical protein